MGSLFTGAVRWVVLAALAGAVVAFIANGGLDNLVGGAVEKIEHRDKRSGDGDSAGGSGEPAGGADAPRPSDLAREWQETRSGIVAGAWRVVRIPLFAAVFLIAVSIALRMRARRRRSYVRFHVRPYESDLGQTASITDTWDEIQHALLVRWWRRLIAGQPSLAAEIHSVRTKVTKVWEQRLSFVLPDERRVIDNVEAALRSTYEHVRMERIGPAVAPPWVGQIVRLKRGRSFVKGRLATPVFTADGEEAQQEFCVDRLAAVMAKMQTHATVQLVLTPTPASFERAAHWWLRRHEEDQLREIGGEEAGTRSTITREELVGAAEGIAHRPFFFAEIRVAADERPAAEQLATVVQGATRRGENKLVRRFVRVRRGLYARRLAHGEGNPLPSFLRGVLATAEVAAVWRLPNPFRNAGRTTSHMVPLLRPDPEIRRVNVGEGIVCAEPGQDEDAERGLSIWEEDLRANLGIVGTVNAGKTTALIRAGLNLARDPNRAVFFIDPKEDGWRRFLAALETPADRPVYIIDCAHPEAGFSPLYGQLAIEKRIAAVEQGVLEMHRTETGEVQMYAPSRAALNVASEVTMRFLEEPRFDDIATILSATEQGDRARAWAHRQLYEERKGEGRSFSALLQELEEMLAQLDIARSAFTQRLAAPRNKVSRLRVDPMRSVLQHPVQVDIAKAIEERAIVVVNGAQGQIDAEPMRGLISMFLVQLLSSVLRQQGLPEDERADVSLILDEAHFFLGNEYLKEGLATARSAGLSSILAFQHFGQLSRDQDIRALTALIGSWLFFRVAPEDAEAVSNLMQLAHVEGHRLDDEGLERLIVNPRALSAAPRFTAVGTFICHGRRTPPFTAGVEQVAESEALVQAHLQAQRGRIGARRLRRSDREDELVRPWDGQTTAEREEETAAAIERNSRPRRRSETKSAENQLALIGEKESRDPPDAKPADDSPADGQEASSPVDERRQPSETPETTEDADRKTTSEEDADKTTGSTPSGGAQAAPPAAVDRPAESELLAKAAADAEALAKESTGSAAQKLSPAAEANGNGSAQSERRAALDLDDFAPMAPYPIPANLRPPPKSYTELDRYQHVTSISYEEESPQAASPVPKRGDQVWQIVEDAEQPNQKELEVMRAIWRFKFMASFQIARRFYNTPPTARKKMNGLVRLGLVEQFVVNTRGGGRPPLLYQLTRAGYELLKLSPGPGGWVPQGEFQPDKQRRSATRAAHDIEAISWALAFEDLAEPCIMQVLDTHVVYQQPPARRVRERGKEDEWVRLTASEIPGLSGRTICGLDFRFGVVRPDVAFEIEIAGASRERRFDLLVEYERTPTRNEKYREKLRHYDAMLTAWWRENPRYRNFDEPPAVLFVVPDWEAAYKHAAAADEVMWGGVGKASWTLPRYSFEGRRRIFFTAAPLAHQRTTLAYQLPPQPPKVRAEVAPNRAAAKLAAKPRPGGVVEFPPRAVLQDPARIERPVAATPA
jgi:hypothetical protein